MEIIFGMTGTLFLGLMFLAAGRFFLEKEKKLKITGIKTTAKITEKKSGYRKSLLLTVEYTADNKLIKKKIVTSRFILSLEKGDEISIFYKDEKVGLGDGELLFTDYGISGSVIFESSCSCL